MHVDRLIQGATVLLNNGPYPAASPPNIFDMQCYGAWTPRLMMHPELRHQRRIEGVICGAPACALGYLSCHFGPTPLLDMEDWYWYGVELFDLTRNEFNWCFSCCWTSVDNTREGAAKRMLYLARGKPIPDLPLSTFPHRERMAAVALYRNEEL